MLTGIDVICEGIRLVKVLFIFHTYTHIKSGRAQDTVIYKCMNETPLKAHTMILFFVSFTFESLKALVLFLDTLEFSTNLRNLILRWTVLEKVFTWVLTNMAFCMS